MYVPQTYQVDTSKIKLTFPSAKVFLQLPFIIRSVSQAQNFKDICYSFSLRNSLSKPLVSPTNSCSETSFKSGSPSLLPMLLASLASDLCVLSLGLFYWFSTWYCNLLFKFIFHTSPQGILKNKFIPISYLLKFKIFTYAWKTKLKIWSITQKDILNVTSI